MGMPAESVIVFDADDTLWDTEHLYDAAREQAARVVVDTLGVNGNDWCDLQKKIDIEIASTYGLSRTRFGTSSVLAYEQTAREYGMPISSSISNEVRRAADSVFSTVAPVKPDARSSLAALFPTHPLALLTKGDQEVQRKRIDDSGLSAYFSFIAVANNKTVPVFEDSVSALGGVPSRSWSIGNSFVSDIEPAVRAGMHGIWIDAHVWGFEKAETMPNDIVFTRAESLSEAANIIINLEETT